jgi:hypothetical protein
VPAELLVKKQEPWQLGLQWKRVQKLELAHLQMELQKGTQLLQEQLG